MTESDLEAMRAEVENCRREVAAAYDELERTNKGVVALYAEIDDKNLQLREATASKTRFLRSISHELRTPVNSILGLTRLMLDPRQSDQLNAEQTEQVEFVRASASDLSRLVEELLDLAKAESGRLEPVLQDVSLADLFESLRGVVEPLLRDGVTLDIRISGVERVHTDPTLLRHVLRNLLSNAAKFTVAGTITLSAVTGAEHHVELAVTDTGVGISEEDLPKIFEEFFQAPSPLQVGARGTGLGLAFAQVVAKALGGNLTVESEPEVGSTFCLSLRIDGGREAGKAETDA